MIRKSKTISEKKDNKAVSTKEYAKFLVEIKKTIKTAQVRAVFAVNRELLKLYWSIGHAIVSNQKEYEWGSNVIEKLANDLQSEFPGLSGFSRANVFNMRAFYLAYEKIQQPARQLDEMPFFNIPWWHNIILITKLKDNEQRMWYAQKAVEFGWSRPMLEHKIKSDLYRRDGKAITNFQQRLPMPDSDISQQSFKDPYCSTFLR